MTGKELFENFMSQTRYINPNRQINDFLNNISSKFDTAEILNSLMQIRRGGRPGKDICQVLFIYEKLLYEITYTSTKFELSSYPVKSIGFISIKADNEQQIIKGTLSGTDEVRLIISCGDYTIEYLAGSGAFEKLLRFRDALTELSK
jgi:hypothetical protein